MQNPDQNADYIATHKMEIEVPADKTAFVVGKNGSNIKYETVYINLSLV